MAAALRDEGSGSARGSSSGLRLNNPAGKVEAGNPSSHFM